MRNFGDDGPTRSELGKKVQYEGYLSPLTIRRFGEYMRKHQTQEDGQDREADNWQKGDGIPQASYMDSLLRHFIDIWGIQRGHWDVSEDGDGIEDLLCALLFNAMGLLHEKVRVRLKEDAESKQLGEKVFENGLEPHDLTPTETSIMRHMFETDEDPDFVVIHKQYMDFMTADKLRRIEEILSEDVLEEVQDRLENDEIVDTPQIDPEKARTLDLSRFLPELPLPAPEKRWPLRNETEARMRQEEAVLQINKLHADFEKDTEDHNRQTTECQEESIAEHRNLRCSDCGNFIPQPPYRPGVCAAGKTLLERDPKVGICGLFEKETE